MQIYFLVYLLPKILTSKLSYMVYAMVLPEGAMVTSILPLGSQWPSLQANWSTRSPGCPAPESADVWLNTPESFGHGITVSVVPFVAYTQTAHPHPTPTPPPRLTQSVSQHVPVNRWGLGILNGCLQPSPKFGALSETALTSTPQAFSSDRTTVLPARGKQHIPNSSAVLFLSPLPFPHFPLPSPSLLCIFFLPPPYSLFLLPSSLLSLFLFPLWFKYS